MALIHDFLTDECGVATAEYALLLALITVGSITAIQSLRGDLMSLYDRSGTAVSLAR